MGNRPQHNRPDGAAGRKAASGRPAPRSRGSRGQLSARARKAAAIELVVALRPAALAPFQPPRPERRGEGDGGEGE